jgi:hypothetical protein
MAKKFLKLAAVLAPAVFAVGCATHKAQPYDYRAFEASNPHSILVLPPLNNSPEVGATESVYSTVTYPLAEAGYYVMPVSLVNETFKQNGLTTAADIQAVAPEKLREIFGADAALYITVDKYGSSYNVLSSVTMVSATAKLVDLKTKALLWDGKASVVDNGNQGNNGGGLVGMLVQAAVTQIVNSSTNRSHEVAAQTNALMLSAGGPRSILYGPRSPNYTGRDSGHPVSAPVPAQRKRKKAAAPAAKPAEQTAPVTEPAPTAAIGSVQPVTAVVAQPVATVTPIAPQLMPAATLPVAAAEAEATPNALEQSYADALARAQSKYQTLNPGSPWYRQELYDWVMERKDENIRAGKAPDAALQQALVAMEGR